MARYLSYDSGQWKVVCDVCGRRFKSHELNKRWDGLMVCMKDWEPRQPQDFVKGVADIQAPPWARPEGQDIFIGVCTPNTMTAIVEYGAPDCVLVDFISSMFDPNIEPLPCIPYYVWVDMYEAGTDWGCNSLFVDADLTLDGTIGVI